MKYTLSSKKKSVRKKQSSPATTAMLPAYHLPGKPRGFSNAHLVHDYQYPQTILYLFKETQKTRFQAFLKSLSENRISDKESLQNTYTPTHSKEGCLRWVYQSNYINDGQERFEASDDISFDVRGHFCADCELARRMVELRPVAYDTPEPGQKLICSQEGYTNTSWQWSSQPLVDRYTTFDISEKYTIAELSRDKFTHLISLISSILPENFPIRKTCYTFLCGNALLDVSETMPKREFDNLDLQTDIIEPLKTFSQPFVFEGTTIRFVLPQVNPFVPEKDLDGNLQECFYDPHLKINIHSKIVHSMAIHLTLPKGRSMLIHCPSDYSGFIDYKLAMSLDVYPDLEPYYPYLLFNKPGFNRLFIYSVMFLMERRADSFKTIFNNPSEIRELCQGLFEEDDAERFRKRIIVAKPASQVTFPQCVVTIRNCILGLRLYTE
jgi:hypothetical protein